MRPTSRRIGCTARPAQRAIGEPTQRNEPAELPRIAATLAELRGWSLDDTAAITAANAMRRCRAWPR